MRTVRPAKLHRSVVAATLLFAAGGLAAAPARADHPSPLRLHREVRAHVHDVLRHLGRIPDRIERRHRAHLEIFLGGREYYRPHRHDHEIYNFPVHVGGGVEYRPYSYCRGEIYGAARERPYIWVEWGRDGHGAWCDHHRGYYPRAHACFRTVRDRYDGYHRDDRYGRYDRYDRYDHRDDRDRRYDRRHGHRHGRDDDWDRDRHRGRGKGRGHHRHDRYCGHH
jgi:hypothetical protein